MIAQDLSFRSVEYMQQRIGELQARVAQLEKQLKRYKPKGRYAKMDESAWAIVDEIVNEMRASKREVLSMVRYPRVVVVRHRVYRALFEGGRYSTTQIANMLGRDASSVRDGILTDRQKFPVPIAGARHTVPPTETSCRCLREK